MPGGKKSVRAAAAEEESSGEEASATTFVDRKVRNASLLVRKVMYQKAEGGMIVGPEVAAFLLTRVGEVAKRQEVVNILLTSPLFVAQLAEIRKMAQVAVSSGKEFTINKDAAVFLGRPLAILAGAYLWEQEGGQYAQNSLQYFARLLGPEQEVQRLRFADLENGGPFWVVLEELAALGESRRALEEANGEVERLKRELVAARRTTMGRQGPGQPGRQGPGMSSPGGCFGCGQIGHKIAECPKRLRTEVKRERQD